MDDIVIRVDKLGKRYSLGQDYSDLLSERLSSGLRSLLRKIQRRNSRHELRSMSFEPEKDFWALKDVSFEIKQGEVVGIIGRNGAGKSTLLKILSRITEPTEGQVELLGRVGSLLEVGTGFHPELSGRENIFLNGAILGMKKAEIKRKFDEIVAFAEVEKFIDTPVKHYSSGMYVRLAFAVAAHLEPEILIIDEVLAVGDAAFQKKCLGKMGDVAKEGRTVLFVSHNMGAVKSLCCRAILFDAGKVVRDDFPGKAVDYYLGGPGRKVNSYSSPDGMKGPHFRSIELVQEDRKNGKFASDRAIRIIFRIENVDRGLEVNVFVRNEEGLFIHHSSDSFEDKGSPQRTCEIPAHALSAGTYHVDASLSRRGIEVLDYIRDALIFETDFTADSDKAGSRLWQGVCGPGLIKWDNCGKQHT